MQTPDFHEGYLVGALTSYAVVRAPDSLIEDLLDGWNLSVQQSGLDGRWIHALFRKILLEFSTIESLKEMAERLKPFIGLE